MIRKMGYALFIFAFFMGFQFNPEKYYTYDEVVNLLRQAEKAYPQMVQVYTIGKSLKGKDIWAITLSNPKTGNPDRKPALYIDGNIHGNEVQGTEVALYTLWYLLSRYGQDKYVTQLVDTRTFYFVPIVNVDGREVFFKGPSTADDPRENFRPYDDDGDGLVDEDGLEDLDGDGEILMMRKKDEYGPMKTGADPRILSFRALDEKGEWRSYWTEGIDNDGDGKFNEDPAGGYDLNRNFPYGWRPGNADRGGFYPLSEPETRSVALFILSHPNIAGIMSYHNAGNMILRAPSSQRDTGIPREDIRLYDSIGNAGRLFLPDYQYMQTFEGLYPAYGTTIDFGYLGEGVISFTNELFTIPTSREETGSNWDRWIAASLERLKYADKVFHGEAFVDWKPFHHPQLGDIELGGWKKISRRTPPPEFLHEILLPNTLFTLYIARLFPQVQIHSVQVKEIQEEIYRIEVEVTNEGFMPTATKWAQEKGIAIPDRIEIEGEHITVLSSGEIHEITGEMQSPEAHKRISLGNLNGRERKKLAFLVSGWGKTHLKLISVKGGWDETTLEL